jgi:hypothetical protein
MLKKRGLVIEKKQSIVGFHPTEEEIGDRSDTEFNGRIE